MWLIRSKPNRDKEWQLCYLISVLSDACDPGLPYCWLLIQNWSILLCQGSQSRLAFCPNLPLSVIVRGQTCTSVLGMQSLGEQWTKTFPFLSEQGKVASPRQPRRGEGVKCLVMLSGTGFAPKRDWLGFGKYITQKKMNSNISEIVIQVSWVSQSAGSWTWGVAS